ncbi:MAG TPA: SEC-C metal-binding domain-containing protein [Phycisphaerae bacterium]|nr:SEC-C metal-binding domain-containing protein [Phycisphaerae bacterium]
MKAGRNDPCPCGSGRKYKKCCLGKEQSRAAGTPGLQAAPSRTDRARPATPPPTVPAAPVFAPAPASDTSVPPPTPRSRLAEFRKLDHPGRCALFDQSVTDGLIDGKTAREMLGMLREQCLRRGERDRFDAFLASLRRHRPDVYQAGELEYLQWAVADAAVIPRYDLLAVRARELAALAGEHFDAVVRMVDLLAWHDQLDVQVKALRVAWRRALDAVGGERAEAFTALARDVELLDYLQHARRPRADDPDLLSRLNAYGPAGLTDLTQRIAHLTGQSHVQPPLAGAGGPKFALLSAEFIGHAHRQEHVSWSRADLGARAIADCLAGGEALLPNAPALDSYLRRAITGPAASGYRAAAAVELLPAWARFLASGDLLAQPADAALALLAPSAATAARTFATHLDDPAPPADVARAWEDI